jgi:3-oxoacyl-[acyl-carrier protein] reductase
MDLDLSGKRALVCGASAGIGRAVAMELAQLGASVTAAARSEDKLRLLAAELPITAAHAGQRHDYLVMDLSLPEAVEGTVRASLEPSRPWQILVNNTGGPPAGSAIDATPEQLLAAFNAQLIAAHRIVRLLLPGWRASGYGRVINITSTSVKSPIPNLGISNIVRPAVAAWAKCLATELGGLGVTVNNVLPGYTETDRLASILSTRAGKQGVAVERVREEIAAGTPAGRFGKPEEIAAVVAFLASPAAGYVNGINVPVDGGRLSTL